MDDSTFKLSFDLSQVLAQCIEVVIETRYQSFTCGARLIKNWISRHYYGSISSSGVHITGGSKPFARQTASTPRNITALAMCLQFQVSK